MSTKTGSVTIDGLGLFRATYDPALRWNGWLGAPAFDRAEVERIAEWAKDDNTFTWDGNVLLHTEHHWRDEEPGYEPERIEPDANGRYSVGGFNWCWWEAEPDAVPDADTVAEARRIVADLNKHDTGTCGWAMGILRRAESAGKDRGNLDAALALVRQQCPGAVAVSLTTSDQNLYGFVLTEVEYESGEITPHSIGDDLWSEEIENQLSGLLGGLSWDGVVGESAEGNARIVLPNISKTN